MKDITSQKQQKNNKDDREKGITELITRLKEKKELRNIMNRFVEEIL